MRTIHRLFLAPLLGLVACVATHRSEGGAPPLRDDLGTWHRTITTTSPAAQRYFDQGLVLAYSFNHDEAIRSFTRATELDPQCAMAWWGIALCHGPHINFPLMPPEKSKAAWDALQHARAVADHADDTERALIDALSTRYAEHPPEDRAPLDEAYAAAMRDVSRAHPRDADVGVLAAEAMMDLHPWDLYTNDGEAKAWTPEIVNALEAALAIAPAHPGANHLYVHAVEASSRPQRAEAAADRLRTLVPGASHMVHMPSHVDVRLGRYAQASITNERAIAVDAKHAQETGRAGFYRVYMAHNTHFLAFSSMMEGRSAAALEAARSVATGFPPELLERLGPFVDGFLPVVLETQVRFGRWNDVLREPAFPELFGAANAVRHYARGVAFTALGRLDDAEHELAELDGLCAVMDDRPIGNNPAKLVLQIPQHVLRGEWLFKKGDHEAGLAELRAAKAVEDQLRYDEPPDWLMPVRHTLGATLVAAGRYEEAAQAYREDLARFPENGWSLYGLTRCLEIQGQKDAAAEMRARFERAWSRADVKLASSCFCQPGGTYRGPDDCVPGGSSQNP